MVRTTIACARCRKAKIKCVHDGIPPCRGCLKRDATAECVLSGPVLKCRQSPTTPTRSHQTNHRRRHTGSTKPGDEQRPRPNVDDKSRRGRHSIVAPAPVSGHKPDIGFVPLVRRAAAVFVTHFPELGFLHMPSFAQELKQLEEPVGDNSVNGRDPSLPSNSRVKLKALCSAIVALCAPLMTEEIHCRESYAAPAISRISVFDLPDRHTVQTLLVLAMYEWGNGRAYRAWIYSGMATRMVQLLHTMSKSGDLSDLQLECLNRTFWSCYVMDRLIVCGKPQPLTLPLDAMEICWPVGQRDFAFGHAPDRPCPAREDGRAAVCNDLDDYYRLLLQGYDIWAQILKWITVGGRRREDLCSAGGVPWAAGSLWGSLHGQLQAWRSTHGSRIRFPDTTVEAHVSLGQGYAFAYINLIYYISLLFLGREYIPFLPTPTSEPSGPVDPPLLPQDAPLHWWSTRADELFSSASHITSILRLMDSASAPFLTPFAAFCTFSAATMNIYVSCFPRMNLGRSEGSSEADTDANLEYLDRFRTHWRVGQGWWDTIRQTQSLYQRASRDRVKYRGKTRDDFVALESSMHDSSGISPSSATADATATKTMAAGVETTGSSPSSPHENGPPDDTSGPISLDGDTIVAAAMSLQDLSHSNSHPHSSWGLNSPAFPDPASDWNDIWPLWEEQRAFPYGFDGAQWEDNADGTNLSALGF